MTPPDPVPHYSEKAIASNPAMATGSAFAPIFYEQLPIGLTLIGLKPSAQCLDMTMPAFEEEGLVLTFLHCTADLRIASVNGQDYMQEASSGLALLSASNKSLRFRSDEPAGLSAVILFINRNWIGSFMKDNIHFSKIEQVLEEEKRILSCRPGRRQLSLLHAMLAGGRADNANLLEMQNSALALLEYFLCNRHRSLLSANPSDAVGNEDDLLLIREVESYISEYYCSDTFTVDSILKKTYTSYHKLNFLFKSIHGMTISEYIRNKRIERSKEMIADNAKSISQIAYEIGYSSISNYILAFKKIYQITPGKYKKQMDSLA
jgi:AraC-like DNA-binding protein